MTDVVAPQQATSSPPAPAPAKKAVAKKPKNPRAKPSHPPTSEMVNGAIKSLKERGGSSLQAIKKYVAANYKVDAEKMAPFIKKYLKAAVASGALVQTKGKGASGSFKLSASGKKTSESAVTVVPKAASRKAPKARSPKRAVATAAAATSSSTKKPASDRKTAAAAAKAKKPMIEKKAAAVAAKSKSPSKAKRATKGPTKKPKAPKPKTAKKAGGATKATPKKAASPKKK